MRINGLTQKNSTLYTYIGVFVLVLILGIAGSSDYDEHVILHMSYETYDKIVSDLSVDGNTPSDHEIVVEYNKHYRHAENN